ncbi:MAG: transposase [Acidobacteriota bacterium]
MGTRTFADYQTLLIKGLRLGLALISRTEERIFRFRDDADRRIYLSKLLEYTRRYGVRLYAYCLMSNHVHHLPVPSTVEGLSRCLHDLHGFYADYFNRKYQVTGHLWQDRFYACVLGDTHLWNAVRYVERNPMRAKLACRAEDYVWSSAPAHCGLREDPLLDSEFPPPGLIPNWSAWPADGLSSEDIKAIRVATSRGTPYASKPIYSFRDWSGFLESRCCPAGKYDPRKHPEPDLTALSAPGSNRIRPLLVEVLLNPSSIPSGNLAHLVDFLKSSGLHENGSTPI